MFITSSTTVETLFSMTNYAKALYVYNGKRITVYVNATDHSVRVYRIHRKYYVDILAAHKNDGTIISTSRIGNGEYYTERGMMGPVTVTTVGDIENANAHAVMSMCA